MDKLWAPWRIKYIKGIKSKKCIFCEGSKNMQRHYVIIKTKNSIAMLNTFPYNNGHMMASPIRHIRELSQLNETEITDLFHTLNSAKKLLDNVLKPAGYNIGINISRTAGAGIDRHLHIHIVPRWIGDTNFMPVLCNTKIISQSLEELYRQLKNAQSKAD
jgi:ATP adenylyltransferase